MMVTVNIILILMILALGYYIFSLKNQVRKTVKQMNEMPTISKNGSRFFVDFREKDLLKLVDALNKMVNDYESEKIVTKRTEKNLQLSITGLSHDLRTPLTAIDGYVQLLKTTDNPNKKQEYLDIIELSTSKLLEMTNQFYDLNRIDMRQKNLNLEKLLLNELVQNEFLNFFNSFEQLGLKINFSDTEINLPVMADKILLNRVVQNVIQNILRYTQKMVDIDYKQQDKWGIVMIKNNIKFDSHVSIEKVFDRFYTESPSRTNTEASGLGLYISKKIIEKMNGKMDAKLVGQWFTIEIRLPYMGIND